MKHALFLALALSTLSPMFASAQDAAPTAAQTEAEKISSSIDFADLGVRYRSLNRIDKILNDEIAKAEAMAPADTAASESCGNMAELEAYVSDVANGAGSDSFGKLSAKQAPRMDRFSDLVGSPKKGALLGDAKTARDGICAASSPLKKEDMSKMLGRLQNESAQARKALDLITIKLQGE